MPEGAYNYKSSSPEPALIAMESSSTFGNIESRFYHVTRRLCLSSSIDRARWAYFYCNLHPNYWLVQILFQTNVHTDVGPHILALSVDDLTPENPSDPKNFRLVEVFHRSLWLTHRLTLQSNYPWTNELRLRGNQSTTSKSRQANRESLSILLYG